MRYYNERKIKTRRFKMTTFKTGKSYETRFIGDSDLKIKFKVIKRTARTITIKEEGTGDIKTCRIDKFIFDTQNQEAVFPYGKYSMAPILRAERIAS